jgi:hypothetical protein
MQVALQVNVLLKVVQLAAARALMPIMQPPLTKNAKEQAFIFKQHASGRPWLTMAPPSPVPAPYTDDAHENVPLKPVQDGPNSADDLADKEAACGPNLHQKMPPKRTAVARTYEADEHCAKVSNTGLTRSAAVCRSVDGLGSAGLATDTAHVLATVDIGVPLGELAHTEQDAQQALGNVQEELSAVAAPLIDAPTHHTQCVTQESLKLGVLASSCGVTSWLTFCLVPTAVQSPASLFLMLSK